MIPRCPALVIVTCVACVGGLFRQSASFASELELVAHPGKAVSAVEIASFSIAGQPTERHQLQPITRLPEMTPGQTLAIILLKTDKIQSGFWTSPWFLVVLGMCGLAGMGTVFTLARRSTAQRLAAAGNASSTRRAPTPAQNLASRPTRKPPSAEARGTTTLLAKEENSPTKSYGSASIAKSNPHPPIAETTRLSKLNFVDELIQELYVSDSAKRHKIIWELGQRGDTRAVQPLVDLMIDSDPKQRSLILAALSEIGTRTLKPLTRALAISLQDESSDVRKNAIRDMTRVYDMVAQISHLLYQATEDPDEDVQETARWALTQLDRIRQAPNSHSLPAARNSVSPPESLP